MDAPHGYVRLLATKQGLGYLHPHTLPFDFVIDEIAHDFTDEYEDDENDIDDLTVVDHKMAANQPRVPAGSSAGGQFGSTGGAAAGGGEAQPSGAYPLAEQGALPLASGAAWNDLNNQQERLLERAAQGQGIDGLIDRDALTELNQIANDPAFLLNSPQTVYFGVAGQKLSGLEPGDTFQSLGTRSTTQDAGRAQRYRGEEGAVLSVTLPVGTRAMQYTVMGVKETTLLPGSQFKITSTTGSIKQAVLVSDGTQYIKNLFEFRGKIDAAVAASQVTKSNLTTDAESKMAANQPRVPAGSSAGGQFGSTGGAAGAGGGSAGAGGQTDTAEFKAWFGDSKVVDADGNPQVVYHGGGPNEGFDHEFIGAATMLGPGFYFTSNADQANEYVLGNDRGGAVKPAYISIQNPMVIDTDVSGHPRDSAIKKQLPASTIESLIKSSPVANPPGPQSPSQQERTARNVKDAITQFSSASEHDAFVAIGREFYGQGFNDSANHFESYLTKFTAATGYDGIISGTMTPFPFPASLVLRPKIVVVAFQPQQIKSSIGNSGAFDPTSRDITKMAANQPRVPAGSSAGGQFGSAGGGGAGSGAAGGAGKQTDTAEFKAWFGDSKVVDADGNPVVVFHGTHQPIGATESPQDKSGIFFSSDADVASAYAVRFGNSLDGGEAYDKLRAKLIAQGVDKNEVQTAPEWQALQAITRIEGSQVAPVYLKISNPLVLDGNKAADAATTNRIKDSPAEHAKLMAQGYDGMIIHNVIDRPVIAYTAADAQLANKKASVFVVFSTTQIKSSIGNSGAFDPTSRDITKMAANQPRVPAGSSAGGQFGSTSGAAAGSGAGGGMAASEALLTPTTGHYEMAPDRTVSPGNEAAIAYGKANSTLQEGENEGLVSPEIVALSDYTGSGYSETNNLIRANDGLYENLTGPMEASYLSLPREANGFVVGFDSSHTEATSILEDSIRTTYRNGLLEYKGSSRTIDASESAQALQHTGALARLVDNAPALQPTVVYRGVGGSSPGVRLTDMQEALNSGGTVKLNGFTSTSLNPHVAHNFSDNSDRSYVVAIVTRRGLVVNGGPTAGVLGESEVIIPHGTTFKVHAILPAAPHRGFYRNKPVVQMIQVDAPATKMAANQPRVPAGSSAGGQFGSTSGAAAGGGAGGGMAASEALLTPTTGENKPGNKRKFSENNTEAIAYGDADHGTAADEAVIDYVADGSQDQNYLIRHNPGLMEFLSSEMQPEFAEETTVSNYGQRVQSYRQDLAAVIDSRYPEGLNDRQTMRGIVVGSKTIRGDVAARILQHTAVLNTLVNNSPPITPTVVYRGVRGRTAGARLSDMQTALDSGGTVKLNGFTSTSFSPSVAYDFGSSSPNHYVMAIVTRRGMVIGQKHSAGENELLMPHGLSYKVHRIIPAVAVASGQRPRPAIVQMIQVDAPATKMAANQPRVPAGSSAGGQFGSTGGGAGAAGGGAGGGAAGAEVTLMHGTSYGSGLKILEEGFLPGEGGFVYATPKRDIAVQYGFSQAQREAIRTNYEDPNAKFAVVTLKTNIQGFAIDNPSSFTDTWQWTRKGPVLPSEILRVEVFSAWDLTKPVEILLPKSLPATKQTPAIRTLFAVVMLRGN